MENSFYETLQISGIKRSKSDDTHVYRTNGAVLSGIVFEPFPGFIFNFQNS